ncbi:MAG: aminotransferase class V-fold PLP-dependent enzyme [Candidatus Cloacimonetes bacterium]|nr:aminotransferase class V-fold PLP-dependent enzyme [Candidatus Cloacimonadota bacterium]
MFKTICFDFDSTLSTIEGIDELAKFLKKPKVVELTKGSMEGKLDVKEAYNKRLALLSLEDFHLELLGHIYKSNLTNGAIELCKILNFLNKRLVIISGGFKEGILPSAKELGIQEVYAIEFSQVDGQCKVNDTPLLAKMGKPSLVESLGLEKVCFIGDGVTDYETKDIVSTMIPYYGVEKRPFVQDCGLESFGGKNLLGLLPLLLSSSELDLVKKRFPKELSTGINEFFEEGNNLHSKKSYENYVSYTRYQYFIPGPSSLNDDIEIIPNQMIGHRSVEFSNLYQSIQTKMSSFLSWSPQFILAGASATGMMEAVLLNLPKGKVLSLRSGAFSDRWADIAKSLGHEINYFDIVKGGGIQSEDFIKAVQSDDYDYVLLTHSESSNGVLNDVEYISDLIKKNSKSLVLIDGVSSVGSISFDSKNMDAVIFGSQKCLSLNPGLAFLWFSQSLRSCIEGNEDIKSFYFDLRKYFKSHDKNTVAFTPPVQTIQKLDIQLDNFLADLKAHYRSYKEMAELVWKFCDDNSLTLYANKNYRSLSVSNIECPMVVGELIDKTFAKGHLIASGYGTLKGSHFRIGHMGMVNKENIEDLLQDLQEILSND